MKRILCLLVLAGLGVGCNGGGAADRPCPDAWTEPVSLRADDPEGVPSAIDDRRQYHRILQEAVRLHEEEKTASMETLLGQVDRTTCRLRLAPPSRQTVSAPDLYRRCRDSVLVVGRLYKCDKCSKWHVATAAGFVLSASGAMVTNYHVVNYPDSAALVVMTSEGVVLPVQEVLAASKADDVCLLRFEGKGPAPLALVADAPVGAGVRVISHPNRLFYSLTEGIVSRYFTARRAGKNVPMMAITADFARGSSGGPVLDERGGVVGLVASTQSIYYAKAENGQKENLQMVIKQCIPARQILALVER